MNSNSLVPYNQDVEEDINYCTIHLHLLPFRIKVHTRTSYETSKGNTKLSSTMPDPFSILVHIGFMLFILLSAIASCFRASSSRNDPEDTSPLRWHLSYAALNMATFTLSMYHFTLQSSTLEDVQRRKLPASYCLYLCWFFCNAVVVDECGFLEAVFRFSMYQIQRLCQIEIMGGATALLPASSGFLVMIFHATRILSSLRRKFTTLKRSARRFPRTKILKDNEMAEMEQTLKVEQDLLLPRPETSTLSTKTTTEILCLFSISSLFAWVYFIQSPKSELPSYIIIWGTGITATAILLAAMTVCIQSFRIEAFFLQFIALWGLWYTLTMLVVTLEPVSSAGYLKGVRDFLLW